MNMRNIYRKWELKREMPIFWTQVLVMELTRLYFTHEFVLIVFNRISIDYYIRIKQFRKLGVCFGFLSNIYGIDLRMHIRETVFWLSQNCVEFSVISFSFSETFLNNSRIILGTFIQFILISWDGIKFLTCALVWIENKEVIVG